MPKISVIVPVYNVEKYLENCLTSLKEQTFKDIEILCINDGSTDDSLKILNRFSKSDARFRVFSQVNSGPAKARNVGLQNARGEFIMFCDADDTYTPDMCAQMYRAITRENVDVVMCDTKGFKKDLRLNINLWYFPFNAGKYKLNQDLISRINVFLWNKIFRASLIRKYKIDFPEGHKSDDNLFVYKYLMSAESIDFLDKKLYNHFDRENSIMDLFRSNGIKLNDLFDKSDIMSLLWDYLNDRNLLERNREAFLMQFYSELFYSWMYVPNIWVHDFFENLVKNIRHIGVENLRYTDTQKQVLFKTLDTGNFYAAEKMLDSFLSEQKKERQKYTFQENLVPAFPEDKVCFVFNCDNRFIRYFSVVLCSLMEHSAPKHNYDIVILHTDITDENQSKIKRMISGKNNFSVRFFNMTSYEKEYAISGYQTINHVRTAAYYRLFIPKIFEAYERVAYLDSDILVNADIFELTSIDLKGYSCGAVSDFCLSQITPDREFTFEGIYEYGKNTLNFTDWKSYFNSGVMVYDVPKIIQKNYFEQFIQVAKVNNRFFNDQNVLNSVLQGDVLLINDQWNMQINGSGSWMMSHLLPLDQIKILHFCCSRKPWNHMDVMFSDMWWEYARKSHFYEIILKENLGLNKAPTKSYNEQVFYVGLHPVYFRLKKAFYKFKKTFGKRKSRDKYLKKYQALKYVLKAAKRLKKDMKF